MQTGEVVKIFMLAVNQGKADSILLSLTKVQMKSNATEFNEACVSK